MLPRPKSSGLFLLFIVQLISAITLGQSRIHGIIVDNTLKTVANANVLLLNFTDSSLVKGMISSSDGTFIFENVSKGRYIVSTTFTGFDQTYSPTITIGEASDKVDVGTISINHSASELNTVTVTGRKPLYQQLIDRTVINVENSITSSGSTALEVLMRSPGIMVDHYNNTISMNGKNGVVLMINGKPSYMPVSAIVQMLSSMPASNIEKIELITTPPANFDAEGNAGYINIVLKTNNDVGTNGSFSVMTGYGKGMITNPALNFNHRKGNVNIYGDGSYDLKKVYPAYISHYRKSTNDGMLTETFSDTRRDVFETNINARLGVDVQAGKKTIVGVLFTTYDRLYKMKAWNSNTVTTEKVRDSSMRIYNTERNHWFNYGANANMQHTFNEKTNLTLNVNYILYRNTQPVEYDNERFDHAGAFTYSDKTRSDKTTPIHTWVGAADVTRQLSPKVSLNTGIKYTFSNFTNDISFSTLSNGSWVRDHDLSALYSLEEDYSAAYATINATIDKKTEMKIGARYEYTNSNLETETQKNIVDRHYGKLFPSVFLTRKIDDNNSINLSFTKRITRPTFNDLAPFTYYADPNTLYTGNSALQPAYANIMKLDYSKNKYFLSLTYTLENGSIQGFQPRTDSVANKQILSAQNIKNLKTLSGSLTLPLTITSWWTAQLNLMATFNQANAVIDEERVQINNVSYGINGSQRFSFTPSWSAEVSGFFQSSNVLGIFVIRPMGSLDIGLRKKLKDNKSSFNFAVTNVLNTLVFAFKADVPDHNIYADVQLHTFFRGYRLTYTRSFGKEKLKANRDRITGSEEERSRVKQQ
jgi:hypothetical protein